MIATPFRKAACALALCGTLINGCVPDANRRARQDAAYLWLLAAEDARPTQGRELSVLVDATASEQVFLRKLAVRALGRLEDPTLVPHIVPLLDDVVPSVRQSAVNALAQAFRNSEGDEALPTLLALAAAEVDPAVRGTIARSIGRLRLTSANRRLAVGELVALSRVDGDDAPSAVLIGIVLGLEALVRQAPSEGVDASAAARLERLTSYRGFGVVDLTAIRIRTLAFSTLGQARRMSRALVDRSQKDAAVMVRVTGARYLDAVPPAQRAELLRRSVRDTFPQTVIEAVRHIATGPRDDIGCRYLLATAEPKVPPAIRVIALDALDRPCPDAGAQRSLLREAVGEVVSADRAGWQPSAHALISLSRFSPDDARAALPDFVGHTNPFVRSYAARAARSLGNESVLRTLAQDPVPNVRSTATEGLFALLGHRVDALLTEQLAYDDPQLLMTVARLLEGAQNGLEVASLVLSAFERVSRAERETWRDSRRALLERVRELGDASLSERLIPFLSDYDPTVAQDVAVMLEGWNGRPFTASPRPLPREPLPTGDELRRMDGASVLLHMQGGGTIEIALHPYLATTNVFRFVRLVREGYFDGLTFHRWAANFVLQGGSPGANEFQGDGPYTRDEVGLLSHWRGTVGISTRGHDTGDGQIFVNLIDNVRLDHAYTIIGTVTDGMDVVDSLLEGAVIERAEIRPER